MSPSPSPTRSLTDYPRPSVAVDVAVLTVLAGELHVLSVEHRLGGRALPGTFLHEGETLAIAAERVLVEKAGLTGVGFRQLLVFDDPNRDDRGWVLSVGHVAAVPAQQIPQAAKLIPLPDGTLRQPLLFDHREIVARAVADLREHYGRSVDPYRLAGDAFTVLALRQLYEAVFGHRLMKDTFRRHVIGHLEDTGRTESEVVGKPAALYRRTPDAPLPPSAAAFFARTSR